MPWLWRQCRSRSFGFSRSQLIWICTVCHSEFKLVSTTWIKLSDWLKTRSGHSIFIYSTGQGLRETDTLSGSHSRKLFLNPFWKKILWIDPIVEESLFAGKQTTRHKLSPLYKMVEILLGESSLLKRQVLKFHKNFHLAAGNGSDRFRFCQRCCTRITYSLNTNTL